MCAAMTSRRPDDPKIERLDGCTWFGTCVITITTALRELATPGRLILLRDLQAYLRRQETKLLRHERNKEIRTGG
jgi:hypothetical protein